MAGYYDPSKDYSRELQRTDLSAEERSRLEQERQNKIDDKYKGVEPNMYNSNKTYSQTSSNSGNSTASSSGSAVRTQQRYGPPGGQRSVPAVRSMGPDTSRRTDLAGQSVKQGHYTVTYNDLGYAVKSVKDEGASATSTVKTTHANDSIYHQLAYEAASRGDWDTAARYANEIAFAAGKNEYGTYDMTEAHKYMNELGDEFLYNANNYYNSLYDQAYGEGASALWDASGGAIKSYKQLADAVGEEQAQKIMAQVRVPSSGQLSIPGYGGGVTGGFAATSGGYGVTGGGYDYTPNGDAYQYIQDMYAANSASQLAALKAAYEQNVMDYNAQDDLISAEAQRQRNQAAAQNELQRMYMNEMGIMQGLNTGATGQMALAQSAALQGNLASIGTQEQQALADSALERSKLKVQYSAAVDQAIAQNNYELANALYQEYVRQDALAQQAAAAAQQQANWQAQFDYQKQQDAWTNAAAQAELLAGFGDFSGYKALGYSDAQIAMMQNAWNAQYGTPAVGTTGTTSTSPASRNTVRYENGSLTTAQVMQLQQDLNKYLPEGQKIAVDGKWGPATQAAAGGYTADEYARVYYKQNSWSGRSDR